MLDFIRGIGVMVKFIPGFLTHKQGDALIRTGLSYARHPKTVAVWPAHVLTFMAFYWHHFNSKIKTRTAQNTEYSE
jgi:hypothetical protein